MSNRKRASWLGSLFLGRVLLILHDLTEQLHQPGLVLLNRPQLGPLILVEPARVGMALGEGLRLLVNVELLGPQRLELRHRRNAVAAADAALLALGLLLVTALLFLVRRLLLAFFPLRLVVVELGNLLLQRVEDVIEPTTRLLLVFYRVAMFLRLILQSFLV